MRFNEYQKFANEICLNFRKQNLPTYWVGGAVRDLILGKRISDIDLATTARPEQIRQFLKKQGLVFFDIGGKFGTVGVQWQNFKLEITTLRTESAYKDFRHPSKVKFIKDLAKDAARRDFTVNALYFDPETRKITDFFNGQKDLQKKILRFIGVAGQKIKEDPLRMMRAARFAAVLDFRIATKDMLAIKTHAALIKKIPAERTKAELDSILLSKDGVAGIRLLAKLKILKYILPELDRLQQVRQSKDFHAEGDAFIHSLLTLKNIKAHDLDLRYAALFHDLGKFFTAKKTFRNNRPHISFIGHGPKGAQIFFKIAKRLRFSAAQRDAVAYLIKHHMDLMHPEQMNPQTIRKYAKNRDFRKIISLRIADSEASLLTSRSGKPMRENLKPWQKLFRLADKAERAAAHKLISGDEVMRVLRLKPSKKIGEILEKITDSQIAGKINTKKQALDYLKSLDSN